MNNEEGENIEDSIKYNLESHAGSIAAERAFSDPVSETAEYVREFSTDQSFRYNENGEIESGNIPPSAKERYWGINNPNFVFSCFDENTLELIDAMQLTLDITISTYEVNDAYFNRKWKEVLNNPNLSLPDKEELIKNIKSEFKSAYDEISQIIDHPNQNLHTLAKANRAKKGEPGAERKAIFTKAVISDRPDRSGEKKGIWGN